MSTGHGGAEPVPTDCWYAVAPSSSVGRRLTAVRALDRPVLLYRTQDGRPVALEDRCAHRAYPLSAGILIGNNIRCGLCGFVYDDEGRCVRVPTQARVPLGATVSAYRVQERDGLLWVWFGRSGRAALHRVPELPWLTDTGWASVEGQSEAAASYLLLHENFADITQIPFVAPDLAPAVLASEPPPLDVVVTETTVALHREFPPAPLPTWQSRMLAVSSVEKFATTQSGFFLSPAVWVDHWDVSGPHGRSARMRFTQLVTPVSSGRSRVLWRVSRDFVVDDEAAGQLLSEMFEDYYSRVLTAMETTQAMLDLDGPGREVSVSADVAALKVREIVAGMLAEEGCVTAWPRARA